MGSIPKRVILKAIKNKLKKKVPIASLLGTQYLGLDLVGSGDPKIVEGGTAGAQPSFREGSDAEDKRRILHDVTI